MDMDHEARKRAIVDDWFPATVDRDLERLGKWLTEDAEMWLPVTTAESIGIPRPIKGRQKCLDVFNSDAGRFFDCPTRQWEFHSLTSEGEYLGAHATMTARTVVGSEYVNDYHFLFRFRGSQICEFWEFNDTAYVERRQREIPAFSSPD